MITVEKVVESNKENAKAVNAVNEELLKTGKVQATKKSYWPLIGIAAAGFFGGYLLWRFGRNKQDGTISG